MGFTQSLEGKMRAQAQMDQSQEKANLSCCLVNPLFALICFWPLSITCFGRLLISHCGHLSILSKPVISWAPQSLHSCPSGHYHGAFPPSHHFQQLVHPTFHNTGILTCVTGSKNRAKAIAFNVFCSVHRPVSTVGAVTPGLCNANNTATMAT